MKIILVRHGESAYNKDGIINGHSNIPLSEAGKIQAEDTSVKILKYLDGVKVAAVYSSDLIRARQTAAPFIEKLRLKQPNVPVYYRDDLREIKLGVWEGRSKKELLEETDESGISPFMRWLESPKDVTPAGAESMPDFYRRAKSSFSNIVNKHSSNDEIIVIFTHGGYVSMVLNYIRGRTPDNLIKFDFVNGEAVVIETCGSDYKIRGSLLPEDNGNGNKTAFQTVKDMVRVNPIA